MPQWLKSRTLAVTLPEKTYFLALEYAVQQRGPLLTDEAIIRACSVQAGAIRARAFMRWLPVSRRGFLRADR